MPLPRDSYALGPGMNFFSKATDPNMLSFVSRFIESLFGLRSDYMVGLLMSLMSYLEGPGILFFSRNICCASVTLLALFINPPWLAFLS